MTNESTKTDISESWNGHSFQEVEEYIRDQFDEIGSGLYDVCSLLAQIMYGPKS
jgi:hypothetical protein